MRHFGVLQMQESVGRWDNGSMPPNLGRRRVKERSMNRPGGGGGKGGEGPLLVGRKLPTKVATLGNPKAPLHPCPY